MIQQPNTKMVRLMRRVDEEEVLMGEEVDEGRKTDPN